MSGSRHANEVRAAIVVTTSSFLGQIRKGITPTSLRIEQAKLPETFRMRRKSSAHLRDMVDVVGHEFEDEPEQSQSLLIP
jgi:hypothetical protein